MECEKCKCNDVEVIDTKQDCKLDTYTGEYYEVYTLTIKCNSCGHEFIENV